MSARLKAIGFLMSGTRAYIETEALKQGPKGSPEYMYSITDGSRIIMQSLARLGVDPEEQLLVTRAIALGQFSLLDADMPDVPSGLPTWLEDQLQAMVDDSMNNGG